MRDWCGGGVEFESGKGFLDCSAAKAVFMVALRWSVEHNTLVECMLTFIVCNE